MAEYVVLSTISFISGLVQPGEVIELNTPKQRERLGIVDADVERLLANGVIELAPIIG